MLGTSFIADLFASVFSDIYEDGVLEHWEITTARDPATGSFQRLKVGESPCKVQFNVASETMRAEAGYTAGEHMVYVLQSGVATAPNSDGFLVARGGRHSIRSPIVEDPARSYWELRCLLIPAQG